MRMNSHLILETVPSNNSQMEKLRLIGATGFVIFPKLFKVGRTEMGIGFTDYTSQGSLERACFFLILALYPVSSWLMLSAIKRPRGWSSYPDCLGQNPHRLLFPARFYQGLVVVFPLHVIAFQRESKNTLNPCRGDFHSIISRSP